MFHIQVFYNPFDNPENPFGDSKSVFDFISCWKTPDEDMGNKGGSYLTFFSSGGLIFGIVNIVGNFGTVFCDQAYWQSSVAAKPLQVIYLMIKSCQSPQNELNSRVSGDSSVEAWSGLPSPSLWPPPWVLPTWACPLPKEPRC